MMLFASSLTHTLPHTSQDNLYRDDAIHGGLTLCVNFSMSTDQPRKTIPQLKASGHSRLYQVDGSC